MPFTLVPPRKGKTPYWYVRGEYLGIPVDRSTGTVRKRLAGKILRAWEGYVERGEVRSAAELPEAGPALAGAAVLRESPLDETPAARKTFLEWAIAYRKAGGENRFLKNILYHKGAHAIWEKPVETIGQDAIDNLADTLYPRATAATRNRQVYTPVCAVLKHAGIKTEFKRPKGSQGKKSTSWLRPEQAFALVQAADKIEPELGLFLRVLIYTGMRLSEGLGIRVGALSLEENKLTLPMTKNGEPRGVHLPQHLVDRIKECRRIPGRYSKKKGVLPVPILVQDPNARLFRFAKSGRLYRKLKDAQKAAGLSFPHREGGFHLACHTYGRWMKKWARLDTYGLVETDRWKDPDSAARYSAGEPTEAARKSDLLPVETTWTATPKSEIA